MAKRRSVGSSGSISTVAYTGGVGVDSGGASVNAGLSKYTTVSSLQAYLNKLEKRYRRAANRNDKKAQKRISEQMKKAKKKMAYLNEQETTTYGDFNLLDKWNNNEVVSSKKFLEDRARSMSSDNNSAYLVEKMVASSLTGIEGMPYQFPASVDRRITNSSDNPLDNNGIGRKFGEKILSRFPLLFVTPCTIAFMRGFNKENKATVTQALLSGGEVPANFSELLSQNGKYYSVDFAYAEYYEYFNCMMNALAIYLGIGHVKVKIGETKQTLRNAHWQDELPKEFKSYFSSSENLVFYVDGFSSVSQSFSNETADSSLASTLNGFSDQINEIKFLFGTGGSAAKEIMKMGSDVSSSITSNLSASLGKLGGGIVKSLANSGVNTILNGGKIIFPEIWSNSTTDDGSASFDFKYRSPDNDTLSIYLNVLKPYCKWLCLTMSHQSKNKKDKYDQHSYTAPFVVKAALKGKFAVDTGIISSLSVTKGAECQWNDDGLPTQIDISVDIKNLYKNLALSGYAQKTWSIVNNTAYMDFIANMAGLNILQMDLFRKEQYFVYLASNKIRNIPSNASTRASQTISRLVGRLYDLTS